MDRFAFSLDETDKAWLEERSDELDISRAELLRRLIAHARRSDTPVIHGDTDGDTPSDSRVNHRDTDSDTLGDTVAELRATVEDHEERLADLEAGGAIAPTALATDTPGAEVEPSDAVVDALEASGWSHGRNREERERNAAVAAWALEVLREHDRECRRSDIPIDALDDDRQPDTVWHKVVRPALLAVAAETDAVELGEHKQRYRWVGE